MEFLHIVCVLIYVTLSEGRVANTRQAYFVKHTPAETGADVKTLLECGVKYLDQEFGVFKISEDGTECTTEPWSWFDAKGTETGYTHYKKDRMTLTYDPPLYFYTNESFSKAVFEWSFPAPMFTDSKVDVYFSPIVPFYKFAIELNNGSSSSDRICQSKALYGDNVMNMRYELNGQWFLTDIMFHGLPFVTETEVMVTIKATLTTLQLLIDDEFKLQMNHSKPVTDIRNLKFDVSKSLVKLRQVKFTMFI